MQLQLYTNCCMMSIHNSHLILPHKKIKNLICYELLACPIIIQCCHFQFRQF